MKGLILLDWDNTVIDENGQINNSHLTEIIQTKIAQGWIVGLNSDTPLVRLIDWWQELCLNGPIIAERGAVIWWPDGQEIIVSATSHFFSTLRQKILLYLSQLRGYAIFFGDNTRFIGSVHQLENHDSVLLSIDAYRICSIGLFVRRIREGALELDTAMAQHVAEELAPLLPTHPLISQISLNSEQCFLSVNALDVDKGAGLNALIKHWAKPPEVIMLGDSIADYLAVPGVRHFAVANAQPSYKERAEQVATMSFTNGCVELLSAL